MIDALATGLAPKQIESIVYSTARQNIWEGSVRSGKTHASIVRWIEFVHSAKTNQLLMTGKTERTLRRNVIEPMQEIVGSDICVYRSGVGEVRLGNKRIYVAGANDESAQEKIRGLTLEGAYCDEITLYPESYYKMLLSRLSMPGAKLFGTTNPDSPYHWMKVDYLDNTELNLRRFKFKLDDNIFLDPEYVASLKMEYTGLWHKRYIDGLWVLADGAVYDSYDDKTHVVDVAKVLSQKAQPRFKHHFVACDYGTNNPCVFGLFGYDSVKTGVYLLKEYYWNGRERMRQKTDTEYAEDMKKFLGGIKPLAIYVDPSASSFIAELRKRGMPVQGARNDVLDGIRFVSSMLVKPRFFIDKSCKETQQEFTAYVWDEKAQKQRGEDKPVKDNDHCMDMVRYGLFSHFYREVPIIAAGYSH